ncbi:MAG: ATP synthase subunit I [Acidimicrobiales bacterium]
MRRVLMVIGAVAVLVLTIRWGIWFLAGAVFAVVAFWLGMWFLTGLAQPIAEPPPPGEMRKVNLRYRCSLCGVELRMTAAPDEEPEPPRHCMEDMDLTQTEPL